MEDGIAVIQMNYMKNLNAIDEQMADELMYVVDEAEKDPNVNVEVLKGTDRAFSAGGDIGYFYDLIQAGGEVNMDGLIAKIGIVADGMKKMSKMVITSVCGATYLLSKSIGTSRAMELAATGRPVGAGTCLEVVF